MSEAKERKPPPYPLAMVLCDAIWRDPATGKRFLLGCFSTVHAAQFPATHPVMAAYLAVTDGHGTMPFRLQLIDDDEDSEPLFVAEGQLEFPDPRAVLEIDFALAQITFPHPGEYRLQFFAAGEWIMERRIPVVQLTPPPS